MNRRLFLSFFASFVASLRTPHIQNKPSCPVVFFEDFSDSKVEDRWIPSDIPKYTGAWEVAETDRPQSYPGEKALIMRHRNAYHAISTLFRNPISSPNQTLVIQYEVRPMFAFTCSGAYLKLFSQAAFSPQSLSNETRHTIMFGPDRCMSSNKVHFIFNHFNKKSQKFEEKALKDPPQAPTDAFSHLYTLVIRPNNTFSILIDNEVKRNGSLFFDFSPAVVPPREIPDPSDIKPSDWDDSPYVVDQSVKKPDGFQGNWKPAFKANPKYKGEWKPKKIMNPEYYVDMEPYNFAALTALGFELWVTNRDIAFTNILIARDEKAVAEWNKKNFIERQKYQMESMEQDLKDGGEKGFIAKIAEAARSLRGSWMNMYAESKFATIGATLLVVAVPALALVLKRHLTK